jgi:hypothetical protein
MARQNHEDLGLGYFEMTNLMVIVLALNKHLLSGLLPEWLCGPVRFTLGCYLAFWIGGVNSLQGQTEVVGADLFANRGLLTGNLLQVTASNLNATKEPGEPEHGNNPGGRSVWWSWLAPGVGELVLTTAGKQFRHSVGCLYRHGGLEPYSDRCSRPGGE